MPEETVLARVLGPTHILFVDVNNTEVVKPRHLISMEIRLKEEPVCYISHHRVDRPVYDKVKYLLNVAA